MIEEPKFITIISKQLNLSTSQVENTLLLLEEGATTPFIARYRKEKTENLDENQIREIESILKYQKKLFKLKKIAIESIHEQQELTPKLKDLLINATSHQEVEDIYAPYKRAKKTKADIAKEKGFESISKLLLSQPTLSIPNVLLEQYQEEEIISGAQDIIAQNIADSIEYKNDLRYYYKKYGEIEANYKSKLDELPQKDQKQIHKFKLYNGFSQKLSKLKSYQILALNRGENLNILQVKLINNVIAFENLTEKIVSKNCCKKHLEKAIKQGYTKLFKSIETELKNLLTQTAHNDSIKTFQHNLKELLLTKPNYNKNILAIDPGFRTGSKLAILDKNGIPKDFDKIFLEKETEAIQKVQKLITKHHCDTIVIGNGTGSDETYELLSKKTNLPFIIVNESGASVYSASKIGAEEFPTIDVTDRGTISIGRRYIDPLSELIKIPVESIGVGMYQHDINQKELSEKLTFVVEDVIHNIGININTASKYLLEKVSGLTPKSAQKLVDNKPYSSRKEIKKILTPKAYEYAIGFLRVPESKEELDLTAIHPKEYTIAKKIISQNILSYSKELGIDESVFNFILESYKKKDKNLRIYDATITKKKNTSKKKIKEGELVEGVIRNIMQFGAFVDIGLKNDGLIHISEIANTYVKEINEFLSIGEKVRVKILSIDETTGKIQLSLKQVESK